MKKKITINRTAVLIMLFVSVFFSVFSAPSYKIDDLKILAEIQKNGSVNITEIVLYDASSINGILYNIDSKGYGELENLQVFYEKNGEFYPAVKQRGTETGNYTVTEDDELYKVKLYYPLRNTEKYFAFRYTLPQGVSVYKDTAQFNRKMVGRNWQNSIRNVEVTVQLPKETDKENIYAFGHGPLTGNIEILNGREIKYTLKNYYPGEFVETNILFPKEMISGINKKYIKNYKAFDDIMAMEKNLADEANAERDRAARIMAAKGFVFAALAGWIIFVAGFVYVKNGKKYKVKAPYGEYFRELPDNYTPAAAGAVVFRNTIRPEHLLATVMDLVRRDFLEMSEEETTDSRGKAVMQTVLRKTDMDISELKDYEKFVLKWYIDELGDGTEVVMEDVERCISTKKDAKRFYSKYQSWYKQVSRELKVLGIENDKKKKFPVFLGMATGFLSFISGPALLGYFNDGRFIIFTFLAMPLIIFTVTRKRLSLAAEEAYARWTAFKKFLVDYSNLEEAKLASIHLWEHYFVYAIALGVAEKVAKGYKKIRGTSENDELVGRYNRHSLMNAYMYNRAFRSVERSTVDVVNRSMREVAKSNRSSSSGRGGGFSGGSSGGGGGRGGGGAF